MPNQYTKFRDAAQNCEHLEFRWRQCTGTKPRKAGKATKRHRTSRSSVSIGTSSNGSEHVEVSNASARTAVTTPLLRYVPSGGLRVDPFRAYPVAPDHSELAVLDYFLHILAPSGKQNGLALLKPPSTHIDPHINLLLPYVMQEPPLFDALLAACQASIALSKGIPAYNDEFFIFHRGRAMARLRDKLQTNVDTGAMLSVLMLITSDYLTGDLKAVADHLRALNRMVDTNGQLPNQTPWEKFVKRGVEGYRSIGYLATGSFPEGDFPLMRSLLDDVVDPALDLVYPEPPFKPAACETWSRLPAGLCELVLGSQISTQLAEILCAVDSIDETVASDFPRTMKNVYPIQAACQRISQHKQATYIERCVAAGVWAYTFQFPRLQLPNLFHDPPMLGFIRLFSLSYRPASVTERNAIAWAQMSVEGFMCTRTSRLPGSKKIFEHALSRNSVMRNWSTLKPVLQMFFCTPMVLERWEQCYSDFSPAAVTSDTTRTDFSGPVATECPAATAEFVPSVMNKSVSTTGSTSSRRGFCMDGNFLQCPLNTVATC